MTNFQTKDQWLDDPERLRRAQEDAARANTYTQSSEDEWAKNNPQGPGESWFDYTKRKQGIVDTTRKINNPNKNPLKSFDVLRSAPSADPKYQSDVEKARAFYEAQNAGREPMQAIVNGQAISMDSVGHSVRQPEAIAAIRAIQESRAAQEAQDIKKQDRALALADAAAKRNREAADWADKREVSRLEIDQKKRANAGLATAQQKPGFIRSITDKVGLTQAQDDRITYANTPEELAQARRDIAAEKKSQKEQGVKFRMDLAKDPNLTPDAQATLYSEAAKEAGVNLGSNVTGAIKQSGEKSRALAASNAAHAAVESVASVYEPRLKSAMESGNLETVLNDMYQQVSDTVRRTGVEPDPKMVKEIVDRRVRAMIPKKVNEPSMLPGFADLLNPAGYAYKIGTQLGERNQRADMRAEAANKLLGY